MPSKKQAVRAAIIFLFVFFGVIFGLNYLAAVLAH